MAAAFVPGADNGWHCVAKLAELEVAAESGRGLHIPPYEFESREWAQHSGQRNSELSEREQNDPPQSITPTLAVFMVRSQANKEKYQIYAIEDACPHAGHMLSKGDLLIGDIEDIAPDCGVGGVVACPAHAFTYDLASGYCLSNPDSGGKATCYEAMVHDGAVYIGRPRVNPLPPSLTKEQTDSIQLRLVSQALDRKYGTA